MARKALILPALVLGPADVNRVLLELQELEDFLHELHIRNAKDATTKDVTLPRMSRPLESLAEVNGIDLLQPDERKALLEFMQAMQEKAPVLHFSFASEPSAAFTAHIVEWLRANVSKYALVQVGLQPSIAAGCIVRSTNRVFDLSLRRHLQQKSELLPGLLRQMREKYPSQTAPAAVPAGPAAATGGEAA